MNNEWIANYHQLKEFIARHPDITIEPLIVAIPAEVRPEFYRLFGAVTAAYIRSVFPGQIAESNELGKEFDKVKDETIALLSLMGIDLEAKMKIFLENPSQGLNDELFDPLFTLIKGNSDIAGFEAASAQAVQNIFKRYFHLGYEYWVALSLICMTAPDKSYVVPVQDQSTDMEISTAYARPGLPENIPDIAVAQYISLDHARITPFIVPTAIMHSQKLQTFVAIAVDLHEVYRGTTGASKKMEWLNKGAMRTQFGTHEIWPDIAIYLHDEAAELRVAVDYANIARPDIVVNVMEDPEWYNNGKLNVVKTQNKALKPRLGSYVVCRTEIPRGAVNEIQAEHEAEQDLITKQIEGGLPPGQRIQASPPIYFLDAGYGKSKLEPIINEIARSLNKSNRVSP